MTARERQRQSMARRRARWRAAGTCVECGGVRLAPALRCAWCLVGNLIRVERSVYKRRHV
jgi:hypothetical protein